MAGDYVPLDADVDSLLSMVVKQSGNASAASAHSSTASSTLLDFIAGDGKGCLDGILRGLDTWQGPAADEFRAQAAAIRQFAIGHAALLAGSVYGQTGELPQNMQYELANIADYRKAMSSLSDGMKAAGDAYTKAQKEYPSWTQRLHDIVVHAQYDAMNQTEGSSTNSTGYTGTSDIAVNVPTFEEWVNGTTDDGITFNDNWFQNMGDYLGWTSTLNVDSGKQGGLHGRLRVTSQALTPYNTWMHSQSTVKTNVAYANLTTGFSFSVDLDEKSTVAQIGDQLREQEYYYYLRKQVQTLGQGYQAVLAPQALDASHLPKGTSTTSTTTPTTTTGSDYSPFTSGGAFNPGGLSSGGSGTDPFGTSGTGTSGTDPFATSGAGRPGTDPFSAGGTGWNPSKLADFNPGGVGGAGGPFGASPFGSGAGSGLFDPSAAGSAGPGGLGDGAVPGGLGSGAAGAAGAASRGMPFMPPMGGTGGQEDGRNRQRSVMLTEDADVWGADGDGDSPAVL